MQHILKTSRSLAKPMGTSTHCHTSTPPPLHSAHTATHYRNSVLHCVAVCCSMLQKPIWHVNALQHLNTFSSPQHTTATRRNTLLQHSTSTPQHLFLAATHYCNTLQHTTATRCNTPLQHVTTSSSHHISHFSKNLLQSCVTVCCSNVLRRAAVVCCGVLP